MENINGKNGIFLGQPLQSPQRLKKIKLVNEIEFENVQNTGYDIYLASVTKENSDDLDIIGYMYSKENKVLALIDTCSGYRTYVFPRLKSDTHIEMLLTRASNKINDQYVTLLPYASSFIYFFNNNGSNNLEEIANIDGLIKWFDEIVEEKKNSKEIEALLENGATNIPRDEKTLIVSEDDEKEEKTLEEYVAILQQKEEEMYRKLKAVPTQNFKIVKNAIESFYESITYKTLALNERPNELGLVIFGPPGVGKTFAVRWTQRELQHDCAWVNLSGDAIDINALSDALFGYNILSASENATKSDFVFGGFVQSISEAIKNGKNTVGIVVNEFNRSAAMGKLDQIIRDVGDNNSILIETGGNLAELQQRLKEEYGIYSTIERNGLRIDLNNVDGNNKRLGVFFVLIGNPPNEYISSAQYGVVPLTAALSRRLRIVSVNYLSPTNNQTELLEMFKNSSSYKMLTQKYKEQITTFIKQRDIIEDMANEFNKKLLDVYLNIYEAFYNLYTQRKIMIVPAPTEIAEQVESAIMLFRMSIKQDDLLKQYKDAFNAYFQKLENVGLYKMAKGETVSDIADTFAYNLSKIGIMFNESYVKSLIKERGRDGR